MRFSPGRATTQCPARFATPISKPEPHEADCARDTSHNFRLIEPGLHLGYRKLPTGPGTWIARTYDQASASYAVTNLRTRDGNIIVADDYDDADGATVLSFAQAQERAKATTKTPRAEAAKPYTVADAVRDYLLRLEHDGRAAHAIYDARRRIEGFVLPALGAIRLDALATERLRRWRDAIATSPPRLRTRKGDKQKHRELGDGADAKRARRATANRTWTVLRAVLNHAFHEGKCPSDLAWRRVKPYRSVDAARVRYLTAAEAKRLLNACDPDFRRLVRGALETGCRYGELARLEVADFHPGGGTISIAQSKSGKPRHVTLTPEGAAVFAEVAAGRPSGDRLFLRDDGEAWGASHQIRLMREACARARIEPAVSFHILRHCWASLAVMAGVPLTVVAQNLGHRDTRMCEQHYSHLAPSYVRDAIHAGAPRFGGKAGNVTAIGRVR